MEEEWSHHLRVLAQSGSGREAVDPLQPPPQLHHLLQSVNKLYEMCKAENSADLVARIYPQMNKLFQRFIASASNSSGLLLLAILQFFVDFGEIALHDADPSIRTFFRSCLSRQFTDPLVAMATFDFLNRNKIKLLSAFPSLLPQYFPLFLKLIAWNGEMLEKQFLALLPGLMAPGSFLPLFPALTDLPTLVVALENSEGSSGSFVGNNTDFIQKSQTPEQNLLQLMDEAYTGSTIEDRGGDSGDENVGCRDDADALFLDLLKDENDGLAERHWTSQGMAATLQAAMGSAQSERLKQVFRVAPRIVEEYFRIALHDFNHSLICALIPLIMARNDALFPDKKFASEIRKCLFEFMLSAFERSPQFISLLKKPIMDRIGEAFDSPAKTELAMQLCWAIGEHGGGGISHKDVARELFEGLELLLYENLSSSRLALNNDMVGNYEGAILKKSGQARFLCFVVTAIAKLATYHRELIPRARVCLAKVARSRHVLEKTVWRRARDYLGLMTEPAICLSILGPSSGCHDRAATVRWSEGGTKAVAHIPFYILGEKEGSPFHDFSLSEILGKTET
ncbi:uncharacterized protein LOC131045338 isoform X1 [Cryptomeria japonica]|uniref:uncharacterized protein LOC131045338 isoform X1 n=1 Tax=Cryptomeria japonica TaxID=3369 RepID=UPI0025AD5763|nr:uncharacterized protein LOC131045338 isoform X1 [Cryptomeria japonica]